MKIVDSSKVIKKSKKRIVIAIAFILIITIPIIAIAMNPIMRPASWTRATLLGLMPIGTSMYEVARIAYVSNWMEIIHIRPEQGVIVIQGWPSAGFDPYSENIVGEQSIRIHLGNYFVLFIGVAVEAFLAFDDDGYLIDIIMRKDVNSI